MTTKIQCLRQLNGEVFYNKKDLLLFLYRFANDWSVLGDNQAYKPKDVVQSIINELERCKDI